MRKNIIITGIPRSGKSTLLKEVISKFEHKVGFLTNEILTSGVRTGFEIETSSGVKSILASVEFQTDFKVSKYFVNTDNLDLILPTLKKFNNDDLLYVDEIGQMALYFDTFKDFVINYLNSANICIATMSCVYDDKFIHSINARDDVFLIEISAENRDAKKQFIELLIKKIEKARRYLLDSSRFIVSSDEVSMRTDHGIRTLNKRKHGWVCNCDFFKEYSVCSHLIALEEYLK